jgi:tripartite-type tricarboxylate transporter receptor subunit TctC
MPQRALAWLALALTAGAAGAQAWPDKTIRLIAVFPPGGSVDQVSRVLAQQLTKQLGQGVVVENIGGASGSIGTAAVAKATPDGATFGDVGQSTRPPAAGPQGKAARSSSSRLRSASSLTWAA